MSKIESEVKQGLVKSSDGGYVVGPKGAPMWFKVPGEQVTEREVEQAIAERAQDVANMKNSRGR